MDYKLQQLRDGVHMVWRNYWVRLCLEMRIFYSAQRTVEMVINGWWRFLSVLLLKMGTNYSYLNPRSWPLALHRPLFNWSETHKFDGILEPVCEVLRLDKPRTADQDGLSRPSVFPLANEHTHEQSGWQLWTNSSVAFPAHMRVVCVCMCVCVWVGVCERTFALIGRTDRTGKFPDLPQKNFFTSTTHCQ